MSGSPIGFRRAALHLGGLWALAFVEPLFRLLGANAEFFVARDSAASDILLMAFGYALVPPLAGAALVAVAGRAGPRLGWAVHLALVALLIAGLVLPPLGAGAGGSAVAAVPALAAGAAAAGAYARAAVVRSLATALAPAPLVVLALLLAFSPVSALVLPWTSSAAVTGPVRSSTPIVHLILDELPLTTLTTPAGMIDAERFPNLARLASGATWYRNATTVADTTTYAVPAQLTGNRSPGGTLPTWRDHPRSLFTLFGRSHDLRVVEPITDVCPPALCARSRPPAAARLRALAADLGVVARHLLLPRDLRHGLPPIDQAWSGFGGGDRAQRPPGPARRPHPVLARLRRSDAPAAFAGLTAALGRAGSRPPLIFLHSTLPHAPWTRLPDGRSYPLHRVDYPGIGESWSRRQWVVDQSFQRHVLQVQYVDALLGRLLRRLRATGLYDEAVVVVSSDHGASFEAGSRRRWVQAATVPPIAAIPLIVKYPRQRVGRIDDGAVRTVDVLPTIAAAAGARLPWPVQGVPAERRVFDPGAPVDVARAGDPRQTLPLHAVLAARRRRDAYEARLLRRGTYAMGPRPDLLGRSLRGARPGSPGVRASVDGAAGYRAIRPGARALPVLVSGRVRGLEPGSVLAVAIDDRIAATTRVERDEDGPLQYAALVAPASLQRGPVRVTILQALPGRRLRRIGGSALPPKRRTPSLAR